MFVYVISRCMKSETIHTKLIKNPSRFTALLDHKKVFWQPVDQSVDCIVTVKLRKLGT